jgi:hypothetical protein
VPSAVNIEGFLAAADLDHSGDIGFTEFVAACLYGRYEGSLEELLRAAFDALDMDRDGFVSVAEIRSQFRERDAQILDQLPQDKPFELSTWSSCLQRVDCHQSAGTPAAMNWEPYPAGAEVEYFSVSSGELWISAVVEGFKDGHYQLNINPHADPYKVRAPRRQNEAALVSSTGSTGSWSLAQARNLGKSPLLHVLQASCEVLSTRFIGAGALRSVAKAVEMLQNGIVVVDQGVCAVFSASSGEYWLVWRSDKKSSR